MEHYIKDLNLTKAKEASLYKTEGESMLLIIAVDWLMVVFGCRMISGDLK